MSKCKILLLIFMCFCSSLIADWKEPWISAVELCHEKKWDEAKGFFDQAIIMMESEGVLDHPHVYVDRARLLLIQDKFNEALPDLDKAMKSPNLIGKERIRGLLSRMCVYANLDMMEEFEADHDEFDFYCTDRPKLEFSKDKIFIRNVPDCKCYERITTCLLIHTGNCKSKDDIQKMGTNWIIKRDTTQYEKDRTITCDCCGDIMTLHAYCKECCECDQTQEKECLKIEMTPFGVKLVTDKAENIRNCRNNCNRTALAGEAWCIRVFRKSTACQWACQVAVAQLKEACLDCCSEGNFYKKCIEPFSDIAGYMKRMFDIPCDPYWD